MVADLSRIRHIPEGFSDKVDGQQQSARLINRVAKGAGKENAEPRQASRGRPEPVTRPRSSTVNAKTRSMSLCFSPSLPPDNFKGGVPVLDGEFEGE